MAEFRPKSDQELDQEWKRTNRPESVVAQNFAASLDKIFDLDNGLDSLTEDVEGKRREVTNQSKELQALEARLKATEERIKRASSPNPHAAQERAEASSSAAASSSREMPGVPSGSGSRTLNPNTASAMRSPQGPNPQVSPRGPAAGPGNTSPFPTRQSSYTTAAVQSMPGALPGTPPTRSYTGSDYVMVDRSRAAGEA